MKLIVGLGNPGRRYQNTRHNIGFQIVDQFAKHHHLHFDSSPKFESLITEQLSNLLIKPQTMMNSSGQAVRAIANYYRLTPEQVLVVFDDADLEFGQLRTGLGGGSGGHLGVKSIVDKFGANFWRLRIGIKSAVREAVPLEQFVLELFTATEQQAIVKAGLFDSTTAYIEKFLRDSFEPTTFSWRV